jgi:hypothetical protein
LEISIIKSSILTILGKNAEWFTCSFISDFKNKPALLLGSMKATCDKSSCFDIMSLVTSERNDCMAQKYKKQGIKKDHLIKDGL